MHHNKLMILTVAFLIWLWGAWNTQQFLNGLGLIGPVGWGLSFVFQGALTYLQAPIWVGRAVWHSWFALAIDVFLNLGGLYDPLQAIDNTKSFQAVASGLGMTVSVNNHSALLLSVLVSVGVAAMVELLAAQAEGGRR